MISFILSIVALIAGYFIYGKLIEHLFGPDPSRKSPALTMTDGVDYVPLKPWRIFLIQFLNIAGVGPICGAILGAQYGTSSYLWIVFGCVFAGAVHDYLSGMISLRNNGCSLPDVHGMYLGKKIKRVMRLLMIVLLILTGVVFINTPATLIQNNFAPNISIYLWIAIIFIYYLIATILPIDKIIGKIYPLFGFLLFAMAGAILLGLIVNKPVLPEWWHGLQNKHPDAEHNPIFPMMFISIACGAISGFHATQSPLMTRCMTNEKYGRPIFYGSMITEGIIALIWAAAASYFFSPESPVNILGKEGPAIVGTIVTTWFSPFFAAIAILGVISAAVTSGDTALRSARLLVADFLHFKQKRIRNRLILAIPLFVIVANILVISLQNPDGFGTIWRYFGWANQLLAAVTLWAISAYLRQEKKGLWYLVSLIPALFMTMVTASFLLVSDKIGFGNVFPRLISYTMGGLITLFFTVLFFYIMKKRQNNPDNLVK